MKVTPATRCTCWRRAGWRFASPPPAATPHSRCLGPGDSFGELALFTERHRRTATATALEAVETLGIGQAELAGLRSRDPQIDRLLIGVLAAQVQRLSRHLLEALYVPVEKRVLRRLLGLAEQYAPGQRPPSSR